MNKKSNSVIDVFFIGLHDGGIHKLPTQNFHNGKRVQKSMEAFFLQEFLSSWDCEANAVVRVISRPTGKFVCWIYNTDTKDSEFHVLNKDDKTRTEDQVLRGTMDTIYDWLEKFQEGDTDNHEA